MKRIIAVLLTSMVLLCACSQDRQTSDKGSGGGEANNSIFDAGQVVAQYRKAINQDDSFTAKSFIGESVIVGTIDGKETATYTKEEMDSAIDGYSHIQQEYNNDTYIDKGDYWVIVEANEPNYITSLVWGIDREKYNTKTKYVVKNDYITEIYTETSKEIDETIAKLTEGVVGIECEIKDETTLVISSIKESLPAYNAGLKVGDIILSIDETPTEYMRFISDEHLYRLRGEVGSSVDVVIERDGNNKKFTLKRVKA